VSLEDKQQERVPFLWLPGTGRVGNVTQALNLFGPLLFEVRSALIVGCRSRISVSATFGIIDCCYRLVGLLFLLHNLMSCRVRRAVTVTNAHGAIDGMTRASRD
jgi:hypothetical protein